MPPLISHQSATSQQIAGSVSKRIKGYDIARGLAVFIMVFVNFQMVLAIETTEGLLPVFFDLLHGKGAALFVVLAGAGMSLMVKSARQSDDRAKLWSKQSVLLKRAAFLFVFGLLYMPLWSADILHFYGFYISIGALMAAKRSIWLWLLGAALVLMYPFILSLVDYEAGWNWETLEYAGFWTPTGFLRNLFINGFHPVIPWVAFIFAGLWLGRQDLTDKRVRNRILLASGGVFIVIQIISKTLVNNAVAGNTLLLEDAIVMFGTTPMPPFPLYMISGTSLSFVIIILCILFTEKFRNSRWIEVLITTGQMAFTHYVGHVVIGMLAIYIFFGEKGLSLSFVFWYALAFCVVSVLFSWLWRKRFKRGPMSLLMRWITG